MRTKSHCVRCQAAFKAHGNRRYCNKCKPIVRIIRGKATCKVRKAIEYGRLPPPNKLACVDCGKRAQIYEHRSYVSPLDVVPTCRSCNYVRGPADWGHKPIEPYFLEPAPL